MAVVGVSTGAANDKAGYRYIHTAIDDRTQIAYSEILTNEQAVTAVGFLLEEWAYIRPWSSETQRHAGYRGFIHFYNHHRPHGALG